MLSITKKTGYGLIAMTHLARADEDELSSAREIARTFGISTSLLMNILKELAAAGYVKSVRGAHGGYHLALPPEQITMGDMVRVLEGPIRLAECIRTDHEHAGQIVCDLVDHCPIADPVHRVQRKLNDFFESMTLAEIAEPVPLTDPG